MSFHDSSMMITMLCGAISGGIQGNKAGVLPTLLGILIGPIIGFICLFLLKLPIVLYQIKYIDTEKALDEIEQNREKKKVIIDRINKRSGIAIAMDCFAVLIASVGTVFLSMKCIGVVARKFFS